MTDTSELRRLAEAATPGPWEAIPERGIANFHTSLYSEGYKGLLIACGDQNGRHTADIKFIAAASPSRILALLDELEGMRTALEWYGENARLCRLIHSEGDVGRYALAGDGGKRARTALKGDTHEQ